MTIKTIFHKIIEVTCKTIKNYPKEFWIIFVATLINSTGSAFITPFLTLYIRSRFEIPMASIGFLFLGMSGIGLVSGIITGYLADYIGRKKLMVFGLFISALTSLTMGFANSIFLFAVLALIFGFLFPLYGPIGPIAQTIIADIVKPEKRTEAYGLIRVTMSLGIALGLFLGGVLAEKSYTLLFIGNALTSLVFATLILLFIRETKPETQGETPQKGKKGYGPLLKDIDFVFFWVISILIALVYAQSNTNLPVFLKENYGISIRQYGFMMSINALMVVFFQFPVALWAKQYRSSRMMALGSLLYAIGFGLTGVVKTAPLFIASVVIWSLGELFHAPVSQAFVANIAPSNMRARYMGAFGLTWNIGWGLGPFLSGLLTDHSNPHYVWYACFIISMLSSFFFWFIGKSKENRELKAAKV